MAKKRRFKIPSAGKAHDIKRLETQYSRNMVQVLMDLFPDEGFSLNSPFTRIGVTDTINPINKKKEYGILFLCDKTLVSIVEAFSGLDDDIYSFALEGIAVAMDQISEAQRINLAKFNYDSLKVIVFEDSTQKLKENIVKVKSNIVKGTPFVLNTSEHKHFNSLFKNGSFPIHIFNAESNPKASEAFKETKRILKIIPDTRVSRI